MNEEMRKKYQLLKEKNNAKVKELGWRNNRLFTECIEALQGCNIISLEESEILFNQMKNNFPLTTYGCIDWSCVENSLVLNTTSDISRVFNINNEYYILWDQNDIPFVSCQLATIIENIDDVLAVSFDTWLLSKDKKEIIEFYHEGKMTYGKISD